MNWILGKLFPPEMGRLSGSITGYDEHEETIRPRHTFRDGIERHWHEVSEQEYRMWFKLKQIGAV